MLRSPREHVVACRSLLPRLETRRTLLQLRVAQLAAQLAAAIEPVWTSTVAVKVRCDTKPATAVAAVLTPRRLAHVQTS